MALLSLLNKSRPRSPRYPDAILPLTLEDVPNLAAANRQRVARERIETALREMPGISQWHPASGEFLIAGQWRHRPDIPTIQILSSLNHDVDLVKAAVAAADASGMTGFVEMESYLSPRGEFFAACGLPEIEGIVTYRHQRVQDFLDVELAPAQDLQVLTASDRELLDDVIRLDHQAFGKFWRNSREEFSWWIDQPGVEVFAGLLDGRVASYFGCTFLPGFVHLDRIAVHPDMQGRGLGKETLSVAMRRAAWLGATTMALSTQDQNRTSRTMYERAGFHHTPNDDYRMYGVSFDETPQETDEA